MNTYWKKNVGVALVLGLWPGAVGGLHAVEATPVIERVAGRGGYVEAAHVHVDGEHADVSGYVRRSTLGEPPAGAHVDVVVLGPGRQVLEAVSVRFSPAKIPVAGRLGLPHARFQVRLAQRPPVDATIRVVFHGGPAGAGGCAAGKLVKTDRARGEGQ